MSLILKYLELVLTSVGLIICGLAIFLLPGVPQEKWKIVTIISLVIATIHGVLFFLVRRRQRILKKQIIKEATEMLQDRVNNLMFVVINGANTGNPKLEEQAWKSQEEIQSIIKALSLDSIQEWKDYYGLKTTDLTFREFSGLSKDFNRKHQ